MLRADDRPGALGALVGCAVADLPGCVVLQLVFLRKVCEWRMAPVDVEHMDEWHWSRTRLNRG